MRSRKRRTQLLRRIDIYLPPDLWREILARLPPKSLLRFRCVCKTWYSLIDDHDFISMHLNYYRINSAKTQLLVSELALNPLGNSIWAIRRSDTFRKIGQIVSNWEYSCYCYYEYDVGMIHGLKLVYCYSYSSVNLILWNPSIRKSLKLPVCPFTIDRCICYLGFADFSGDYKVVAFKDVNAAACEMAVAIYSLRNNQWRVKHNGIKLSRHCFDTICDGCTIFFAGALYWRPPCYMKWRKQGTELVSFDFNAEEFRYLKLPDVGAEMNWFSFIFGESLALFCISEVRSCIWTMEKKAGNEPLWRRCWDKETNVDVYKFFKYCKMKDCQFLYIEDTGTLLVQYYRKLIAYNLTSNQAHYLGKHVSLSHVETYVESLVLHKAYKGANSSRFGK